MKFLNQLYNLKNIEEISLYLVLIFGCLFLQNKSAGSYFAMFLFAGFYCNVNNILSKRRFCSIF